MNWSSATCASTLMRKPPWKSFCAASIFRNRLLYCLIDLALVGKRDFGIDYEREIHDNKFTQDPRESGIRQVLQANPGIKQASRFSGSRPVRPRR